MSDIYSETGVQDFDWGTGWDEENPEETYCEEVVFYGSPDPDSFRFGPDEYCESIAVPGTDRCGKHTYDHDGDY